MNVSTDSSNSTVVQKDEKYAMLRPLTVYGLCISIIWINSVLVHIFSKHEIFFLNPRYILYIHLVLNDIIFLIMMALLYILGFLVHTMNVSLCMLIILLTVCININGPMTLAIMAIECYVAVCFPLHHSRVWTVKNTYFVIVFIWFTSLLTNLPDVFVTIATEPLEFFHQQVLCYRHMVLRHPALEEKQTISYCLLLATVFLALLYTYCKILFAAQLASVDYKKAQNTILLHSFQLILSMLTYLNGVFVTGLSYLFPRSITSIRFVCTLIITIMPRLISPLVYGLRDKVFYKYLKRYYLCPKNNKIDF